MGMTQNKIAILVMIGILSACSSAPRETLDANGVARIPVSTLGYIADQFNRVNTVQIHLLDTQAAQRRYALAYPLNDPASFAALLAREPDLLVKDQGDAITVRTRPRLFEWTVR